MKRAGVVVVVSIVLALGVGVAGAAAPPRCKNCTNLNERYPHGLGRVGAHDKTSGEPVTNHYRSTTLYLVTLRAARAAAAPPRARNGGVTWSTSDGIFAASVDGTGRRMLVPGWSDCDDLDPSWTRDGRALAYVACISDSIRIEIKRSETWRGTELSSPRQRSTAPTWSPDGKRIAVSENLNLFGGGVPIQVVTVSTNTWVRVTKPRRHREDREPAWSPDGGTIAFTR